jgi:hypothetical protein
VTTHPHMDTLGQRAALTESCATGEHAASLLKFIEPLDTEKVMKLTIVELGSASRVTKDYSGNFAWDGFIYDYRKYRIWG